MVAWGQKLPRCSTKRQPRCSLQIKIIGMRPQDWLWIWYCLKHKFGISAQGMWRSECEGECHAAGPPRAEGMVLYLSGIVEGVKESFPVTVDQLSQHCDPCQCVPVVLEVGGRGCLA